MIGLFRQKNPGNVFLLFLLGIFIKLPVFFNAYPPIVKTSDGLLYKKFIILLSPVGTLFPVLYSIIAFLLIFLQAYLLSRFVNHHRLMFKPNFLPGMAFMMISSLLPEWNQLSSSLMNSVIFMMIFMQVFRTYNYPSAMAAAFNSGLLLGCATLIAFPSVLFLFFILLAFAILRPFKPNEWLLIIAGIIAPYYFLLAYLFLRGTLFQTHFFEGFSIGFNIKKPTLELAGTLFLLLMPLLTGIYYMQTLLGKMMIHVRKAWYLFLWYIAICLAMVIFNPSENYENWLGILIPLAAFHGFGFLNAELRIYPRVVFWLTLIFIIGTQFFLPGW